MADAVQSVKANALRRIGSIISPTLLGVFGEWFKLQRELLVWPERCAVRYRYSSESAARNEAHAALRAAKVVRNFIRQHLGLRQASRHFRTLV